MPQRGEMLRGKKVLVAESDYYFSVEIAALLKATGAVVLGPVPSECEALEMMATGKVDLIIFNAELRDRRVDLLADSIARHGVPSLMVNTRWLPSSDPLCRGRPQMLHPLAERYFQRAIRAVLRA